MVQGRLEISARKNPLEVYRKSARVPLADSARKNPLEVSRKSARVAPYTTIIILCFVVAMSDLVHDVEATHDLC